MPEIPPYLRFLPQPEPAPGDEPAAAWHPRTIGDTLQAEPRAARDPDSGDDGVGYVVGPRQGFWLEQYPEHGTARLTTRNLIVSFRQPVEITHLDEAVVFTAATEEEQIQVTVFRDG